MFIGHSTTEFVIYFSDKPFFINNFELFNYRQNPISYFVNYDFAKDSCLITVPPWNATAAKLFLEKKVEVIDVDRIELSEVINSLENCSITYILNQSSVDRFRMQDFYQKMFYADYELNLVDSNENQDLFILNLEK